MNNIRIKKGLTSKDFEKGPILKELRSYLTRIQNFMADETLLVNKGFPDNFRKKAQTLLKKIEQASQNFYTNEYVKNVISSFKDIGARNRHIEELKATYVLKAAIIKGYMFLQEFGNYLRSRTTEYSIMFDDYSEGTLKQSIGTYSLEQLLPTLNIRMSGDKNEINIQIDDYDELISLKNQEQVIKDVNIDKIYNKIITLTNYIQRKRRTYVSEKRAREGKETRGGHERGQAGIAYEIAFNEIAKNTAEDVKNVLANGDNEKITINTLNIIENKFHADSAPFYQAGDIPEEYVKRIFKEAGNILLELKRVSIRKNAVGARLIGNTTIQNSLKRIIDRLDPKLSRQEIYEGLKKEFKVKEDSLLTRIADEAIETIKNEFNKNIN